MVGCLAAAGVFVLAGCASSTEQDAAATAATRFLRADAGQACAMLTPRTRAELVGSAGEPCERSLPTDRLGGTVRHADTWSDQAVVDTDDGTLFLTEFDSRWLVSAAGCRSHGDAPFVCAVGG